MLIHDEGLRTHPYNDRTGAPVKLSSGTITIGVGHNLESNGLPHDVIFQLLDRDIHAAINSLYRIFDGSEFVQWSDARRHALVNMVFNLGELKLRQFEGMISAIRRHDWAIAAAEAEKSRWYVQVGARARRVVRLIRDEQYDYPDLDLPISVN